MKKTLFVFIFLLIVFFNTKIHSQIFFIQADSLISNLEILLDKNIETIGFIIHVCGVDGKKMKLKTESGEIIKIIPRNSLISYDKSFYKKRIKVTGTISEYRIENQQINMLEKEQALLCHIDNTPCKDTIWINNKIKTGKADSISKQDIEKLRKKIEQTGKPYISVITIIAEKIEILEE